MLIGFFIKHPMLKEGCISLIAKEATSYNDIFESNVDVKTF
jgi:hypothetical protein